MSMLINLISGQIDSAVNEFDAKTLTRPVISLSDGNNAVYCVDLDIGQPNPLRTVPIASSSRDAFYADVGSAVRVRRSPSGWFEVSGLSKRMPGTLIEVPVAIPRFSFTPMKRYQASLPPASTGGVVVGTPANIGITSRALRYDELATMGGYGVVPYGAIAFYSGGVFIGFNL